MRLKQFIKQNRPVKVTRGMFSKAFIYSDKVLIESCDPVKECISLGWFPDSELFPIVKQSELESYNEDMQVYEMPRYTTSRNVKDLIKSEHYKKIYLPLRKLYKNLSYGMNPYNWQLDFTNAVERSELSKELQEILISAYEACMNFSHKVRFEISPRNVAADADKNLILLDVFFILD